MLTMSLTEAETIIGRHDGGRTTWATTVAEAEAALAAGRVVRARTGTPADGRLMQLMPPDATWMPIGPGHGQYGCLGELHDGSLIATAVRGQFNGRPTGWAGVIVVPAAMVAAERRRRARHKLAITDRVIARRTRAGAPISPGLQRMRDAAAAVLADDPA